MPAMSGLELQAHLLAEGYRVPFIFITAFSAENARAQALKAGASCFLTKPFTGEALINCLDTALREHGEIAVTRWLAASDRDPTVRDRQTPFQRGSTPSYLGISGPTI